MISWVVYVACAALAVLVVSIFGAQFVAALRLFRGTRVVVCPESHRPAEVTISPFRAALPVAFGYDPLLRINDCSRRDEIGTCDGPCTAQIRLSPRETLLRSIVAESTPDRQCALCRQQIRGNGDARIPALLASDGTVVDILDIPPDRLECIVPTHRPLCSRCYASAQVRAGEKAFYAVSRRVGTL